MAKFVIEGGRRLQGTIPVLGSKNAALPLLSACLLTQEAVTIHNVPQIRDVANLMAILESLGAQVTRAGDAVTVVAKTLDQTNLPADKVGALRGSVLLMGPLLARWGAVALPRPGGDVIGARPIDVHLDAFRQLGARVQEDGTMVQIDGNNLRAGEVTLREFSVTATENVMLLAAGLPGATTIHVAATEPHVVALGELLTRLGARVTGAGTHTITVEGTLERGGATVTNIPDMLEAGLFILLGAVCAEDLVIENVPLTHLPLFFKKLEDIGVDFSIDQAKNQVRVRQSPLQSFSMQSLPHPGIPTDLQAPFAVVATVAPGSSLIHDPLYEDRFRHINELQKMGGRAVVCDPHRVIIQGPVRLHGTEIDSLDIRSGATLIMAGLVAEGQTIIHGAEVVERGYERLAERLQAIGAAIRCRDAVHA
ncbi:MAG: UDP-N-acetylglucosamine 1-carboxyvinyltransferase [Parcubacteria group bacterium RIFCSPHIGHO2_01_FULL_56_18]|nr:MAG: UDP-N-acetylglucosamine 1-carboxyvinyltransferase [Parcubacteria group bacterium RIFCSPHIGHO2_01_FULL_56_18]